MNTDGQVLEIIKSEILDALIQNDPLEDQIEGVLKVLIKHLNASIGECWLNKPNSGKDLVFLSSIGNRGLKKFQNIKSAAISGFISNIYERGKPLIINNLRTDDQFLRKQFAEENNLNSAYGIPLVKEKDETFGVFCFFSESNCFQKPDWFSLNLIQLITKFLHRSTVNDYYRTFFNLSKNMFAIVDLEGNFLDINEGFKNTLGYSREEVVGKSYISFLHPEDIKQSKEEAQKAYSGISVTHFLNRYRKKNGNYVWISWASYTDMARGFIYVNGQDVSTLKNQQNTIAKKSEQLSRKIKELNGLYSNIELLSNTILPLDERLSLAIEDISSSFDSSELSGVELEVETKIYRSSKFRQTSHKVLADIYKMGNVVGKLTIYEKEAITPNDRLPEELIEVIATNISRALELQETHSMLHRLSLIAQNTINLVLICDSNGRIEWVNHAFESATGWNLHEIIGKKPGEFLHGPETNVETKKMVEQSIAEHKLFSCEMLKYKKDGSKYWVAIEGKPIIEQGGGLHYFQIETDITQSKETQLKLLKAENKTRKFAQELNRVLEEERVHWAREIHDEFGQQLSGIKLSLSTLDRIDFEPANSRLIISEVVKSLDSATKSLKDFSKNLRPVILDTHGLKEGVKWLIEEFQKKSNIKVNLDISTADIRVDSNESIALFRICQEALNNIAKHSQASSIEVRLKYDEQEINLEIWDNGIGFDSKVLANSFSMGILGMEERAKLIGGKLTIESIEGEYTKVKFFKRLCETS